MSYYAYVVRSLNKDYVYKGHCENLDKRVEEHNSGMTKSLRPFIPIVVVYFEIFDQLEDAIAREKYFKTSAGRRFLKPKLAVRTGIE